MPLYLLGTVTMMTLESDRGDAGELPTNVAHMISTMA